MIKNPSKLASIFSSSFMRRILNNDHVSFLNQVLKDTNFSQNLSPDSTVKKAISDIFEYLKSEYRCEYIYKTAILSELLLKCHKVEECTYLTEFNAFNTKADILILNETSSVYEIKSDVDNLNRLVGQVNVYRRIFEKVNVVSNENNYEKIESIIPEGIGILVLKNDLTISTERTSYSNFYSLDKALMFDCMRKPEYLAVIKQIYDYIPQIPGTLIHAHCRDLFCELDTRTANFYFMQTIKKRILSKEQIEMVRDIDISLKALLSEKYYSQKDCEFINFGLNQNL